MRKVNKNYSKQSSLVIFVVILAMLFTQQIYLDLPGSFSENIESYSQQDQTDDKESQPLTVLDVDQNLIASNIQLNVNHVFYEIMAIEHDEVQDNFGDVKSLQLPDGNYKIQLRQVISPNAP